MENIILAFKKAKEVSRDNPEAIVIGADTLVTINNKIIRKD